MPVTININMFVTLQKIGVDPALLATLTKGLWKISTMPNGIKFYTETGQEHVLSISTTKLMAANKDMLPPAEVKQIRASLNDFIKAFLAGSALKSTAEAKVDPSPIPVGESLANKAAEGITGLPGVDVGQYAAMLPVMAKHQPVTEVQMAKGDLFPLMEATGLYAPVRGTDKTSRYFLMAVFPTFRLAARFKGSKQLSFRLEGQIPHHVKEALQGIAFTPSAMHISQHCTVDSVAEGNRYLGSVITTIIGAGEPLLTPMPMIQKIVGKGI